MLKKTGQRKAKYTYKKKEVLFAVFRDTAVLFDNTWYWKEH